MSASRQRTSGSSGASSPRATRPAGSTLLQRAMGRNGAASPCGTGFYTYFALRSLDADLRLTRDTLGHRRRRTCRLPEEPAAAGVTSELDLRLRRPNALTVAATFRRSSARSHRPRRPLRGWSAAAPGTCLRRTCTRPCDARRSSADVPGGMPSDLLMRRRRHSAGRTANLVATRAPDGRGARAVLSVADIDRFARPGKQRSVRSFNAPARVCGGRQPVCSRSIGPSAWKRRSMQQRRAAIRPRCLPAIGGGCAARCARCAHRAQRVAQAFEAQDDRRGNRQRCCGLRAA